jgi:type IV pilus assembly protein PilA
MYERLRRIREARASEDRGFTLIELLVVVVIIGILVAIAIPLYLNYQKGAHDKSAQSDLRAAVSTLQQCYTENGNKYPDAPKTDASGNLQFTCGSNTETANVSDGTTLTYTAGTNNASYKMTASNSQGSGKSYTYDSTAGGDIQ